VTVTHAFKDMLIHRVIDDFKVAVVTNGVDQSHFAPHAKDDALVQQLGLQVLRLLPGSWLTLFCVSS
jgi:hypothetical protein